MSFLFFSLLFLPWVSVFFRFIRVPVHSGFLQTLASKSPVPHKIGLVLELVPELAFGVIRFEPRASKGVRRTNVRNKDNRTRKSTSFFSQGTRNVFQRPPSASLVTHVTKPRLLPAGSNHNVDL